MSEKSVMSACSCAEGSTAICSVHACRCNMCQQFGELAKKCVWRRHHRVHLKSATFVTKRRQYVKVWKIRKDNKLKSPPCYFELARKKGLDTQVVWQRGRRDLLRIYAQQGNLLADKMHPELVKVIGPHILAEGRVHTNYRSWMSWLLRPLSGGIPHHIPTHVSDGV